MPVPKNYQDLVSLLITGTKAKRVEWTSQRVDLFSLHFDEFSFQIFTYETDEYGNLEGGIGCSLVNDKGVIIDNFSASKNEEHYEVLEELFELARRSAFKIDIAIQKLTEKLSSGEAILPRKKIKDEDDDIPF